MDQQDTCLGCIRLPLLWSLNLHGLGIGVICILNIVLLFFVPYSYVFFGIQSILNYTALIFFLLGVTFNS
jgi:hypothetical protein